MTYLNSSYFFDFETPTMKEVIEEFNASNFSHQKKSH
jgi:hypothetical protein